MSHARTKSYFPSYARFDVTGDGTRLGFEDMCALFGLPAKDKFTGSVERIIKTIGTYCQGKKGANRSISFSVNTCLHQRCEIVMHI